MLKKILKYIKDLIKEEYKFILFLILLFIIFEYPVNYYIITGGGTSNIASRIKVEDSYSEKGSFNISFVEEIKGSVITYLISYLVPSWERESADLYKYSTKESLEDIEFRGNLDLIRANSNATYWAYKLAYKDVEKTNSKIYVITVFDGYETPLKVQDEILSIDGKSYDTIDEYKEYLQTRKENETVEVKVLRKNKEKTLKSKMHKYKDTLILGVGLQTVNEYKVDPKVSINFKKEESGPSGGLITTLEIYNRLTKKDITKGRKIAGTGTIEEDGLIGEIGGIEHKLLGADKAKVDIFLVPSGNNYKDAVKYKKEKKLKIKLIEVKTIEEAINKLSMEE